MPTTVSSDTMTRGIRVTVHPEYMPEHSSAMQKRFIFSYHIEIVNEGEETVQLLRRHWIIINSDGDREDVHGPGVVGYQPVLGPGQSFEYTSYCPLDTDFGTMEGTYTMIDDQGEEFDVEIGRFYLVKDHVEQEDL
ncbi:Co2+/Mg2+ efflux protein ApaG [bacterium]|nr:Co2+/Mg2+ efflux protein ApaG [bacterium]